MARRQPRVRLNEHLAQPGGIVFRHGGKSGFEGIVSKRKAGRRLPRDCEGAVVGRGLPVARGAARSLMDVGERPQQRHLARGAWL